ncbi:MAG TPA: hypothetical protein VFP61_05030 [Acidimicrobiales bacterium]|nr:hypothetical protein [Acidimicrobiales bacterium]
MRERRVRVPLAGITLTEAATGRPVDLGGLTGVRAVTLVRHRF